MKNFHVALIAFHSDDGKILLNRRNDAAEEMWEMLGGGIEEGETPIDAIKREVAEELNYVLDANKDALELMNEFEMVTDRFSAKVHYFKANFPGIDKFSDSEEIFVSDLQLFTVDDALSLPLLPIARKVLEN